MRGWRQLERAAVEGWLGGGTRARRSRFAQRDSCSFLPSSLLPLPHTCPPPSCSDDIGRLEAGCQARWQEAAAELAGRVDRLAASSEQRGDAVEAGLQALQGELAAQRARLDAVEAGLQQGGCSPTKPPAPSTQAAAVDAAPLPAPPAAASPIRAAAPTAAPSEAQGTAPSVTAILRRLSALEGRVGAQLAGIEALFAGEGGSPRSAPASPARGWAGDRAASPAPPCQRSPSRAERAAAVAAAAVWGAGPEGEANLPDKAWAPLEGSPGGSPRIAAALVARPASAQPPSSAEARRSRREVEAQVATTKALIAGIQSQSAGQGLLSWQRLGARCPPTVPSSRPAQAPPAARTPHRIPCSREAVADDG